MWRSRSNERTDRTQARDGAALRRGRSARARHGDRGGPVPRGAADGDQVQLGFGATKPVRTPKALLGHAKRAGLETAPRVLQNFPVPGEGDSPKSGEAVTVAIFKTGDGVKVTGVTKGRGLRGVVPRHQSGGGPETHGNTRHRKPGSLAPGTDPSRIIKGK